MIKSTEITFGGNWRDPKYDHLRDHVNNRYKITTKAFIQLLHEEMSLRKSISSIKDPCLREKRWDELDELMYRKRAYEDAVQKNRMIAFVRDE